MIKKDDTFSDFHPVYQARFEPRRKFEVTQLKMCWKSEPTVIRLTFDDFIDLREDNQFFADHPGAVPISNPKIRYRRSGPLLNERLLVELVLCLDPEELRGLSAPPLWGKFVPRVMANHLMALHFSNWCNLSTYNQSIVLGGSCLA
ncbi:hypothetical protein BUALT_Bualt09G0004200 [Buddleja alternifolia]|uniref:Uncharacterized protein n=1 Tax=Buddleja alternifolia TaxID=168488 RepID=A0AAV6X614_9LAMI|nr:hypothetical protein BUALT_Bualt09G0004200 [Buddleja alternifolia]